MAKVQPLFLQRGYAFAAVLLTAAALLAGGCKAPIGADRVSSRRGYQQVERNALSAGETSADTRWMLHRYGLAELSRGEPEEAVRRLHAHAVRTRERDLLYALSELSFVTGDRIADSVKPWDARDARDYYLGAAVYAYLFLFSDELEGSRPTGFDRRFRNACDLYNHGLGLALKERRSRDDAVYLASGLRRLPVGTIQLDVTTAEFPWNTNLFRKFLLADEFLVRGFSVRVRDPGIGTPLLAVSTPVEKLRISRTAAATLFMRLQSSLGEVSEGKGEGRLELYTTYDRASVPVGNVNVPLEGDLTAPRAYTLNQSFAWSAERLQFLKPAAALKSQLIPMTPYYPGKVPVIFVHGTFSSPIWWGEMFNALSADPELRRRIHIWMFLYSSSNPLLISAAELRQALTNHISEIDPEGKDAALRQAVVIGHSQGGLLTKLTATETSNRLWAAASKKPIDELRITDEEKGLLRSLFNVEPVPAVKRVVFISTPHRGSHLAGSFVRNLVRRIVATPTWMVRRARAIAVLGEEVDLLKAARVRHVTSIDSMSPRNPVLLELAEIPVATNVVAHSIIPVKEGFPDLRTGDDGVVRYSSAHVGYVKSEFIVRSEHSCQSRPETIEEVRRILHEHLKPNVDQENSRSRIK